MSIYPGEVQEKFSKLDKTQHSSGTYNTGSHLPEDGISHTSGRRDIWLPMVVYHSPGPHRMTLHSRLGQLTAVLVKNMPYGHTHRQTGWRKFLTKVPSSQVTLDCLKMKKRQAAQKRRRKEGRGKRRQGKKRRKKTEKRRKVLLFASL